MVIERTWILTLALLASGSAPCQEKEKPANSGPKATAQSHTTRVLYVEDEPRWEYRYLKNGLLRVGKNILFQSWLCGASDDYQQEHSKSLPALRELPRTIEALAPYDVIFIGDVPREALGKTATEQAAFCKAVVEFVGKGGGVAFLAGEKAMPEVYRGLFDQTLLPVILEPMPSADTKGRAKAKRWRAFRHASFRPTPVVTDKSKLHPILMLEETVDASMATWKKLPDLRSYLPVHKLKPGASAILRRSSDEKDRTRVIAAVGTWGKGRTFFIASDEAWLWRKPFGEYYQDTFWFNVVRHLKKR